MKQKDIAVALFVIIAWSLILQTSVDPWWNEQARGIGDVRQQESVSHASASHRKSARKEPRLRSVAQEREVQELPKFVTENVSKASSRLKPPAGSRKEKARKEKAPQSVEDQWQPIQTSEEEVGDRELTFRKRVSLKCGYQGLVKEFSSKSDSKLPISCANFHEVLHDADEVTGSGVARKTIQGTWKGKCVAIKQLKEGMDGNSGLEMMEREAALLYKLREARNIMPLLGYCNGQQVFECMQAIPFFDITPRRRLEVAAEAAAAVAELHSAPSGPFVHRDLHRDQFMMDSNGKVYLQDFNEVQYVGPRRQHSGVCAPTGLGLAEHRTFSPEEMRSWAVRGGDRLRKALAASGVVLGRGEPTALDIKYEIFHLGWLLWSLLVLQPAHKGKHWTAAWRQVLSDNDWASKDALILKYLGWYPSEVRDVLLACWHGDPRLRPSAEEVARRLQAVLQRSRGKRGREQKPNKRSASKSGRTHREIEGDNIERDGSYVRGWSHRTGEKRTKQRPSRFRKWKS